MPQSSELEPGSSDLLTLSPQQRGRGLHRCYMLGTPLPTQWLSGARGEVSTIWAVRNCRDTLTRRGRRRLAANILRS